MSILDKIVNHKKEELKATKSGAPLSDLKSKIKDLGATRSFREAIKRNEGSPVNLIAELKKASPSRGLIREDFNVDEIVSIYDEKDVAAMSVLTEQHYFSGELEFLNEARKRTGKPLLRKDFIIDEYQVYEGRANNADALLLIAAALDKSHLEDLYGLARELSLDCLVEVHNLKELDSILDSGVEIVGINNRDLKTLDITLDTTFNLLKDIPEDRIVVSESGISNRADVVKIESAGVDAILVGTTIMKSADMGSKIDELLGLTGNE